MMSKDYRDYFFDFPLATELYGAPGPQGEPTGLLAAYGNVNYRC